MSDYKDNIYSIKDICNKIQSHLVLRYGLDINSEKYKVIGDVIQFGCTNPYSSDKALSVNTFMSKAAQAVGISISDITLPLKYDFVERISIIY